MVLDLDVCGERSLDSSTSKCYITQMFINSLSLSLYLSVENDENG